MKCTFNLSLSIDLFRHLLLALRPLLRYLLLALINNNGSTQIIRVYSLAALDLPDRKMPSKLHRTVQVPRVERDTWRPGWI
jgi:hypothetical protein